MADRTEGMDLPPFEAEFARAWDTPGHTPYQLPDTDVNKVLAARYITGAPVALTRSMLWDMEARKAPHPGRYIPSVVHAGSDGPGTGAAAMVASTWTGARCSGCGCTRSSTS